MESISGQVVCERAAEHGIVFHDQDRRAFKRGIAVADHGGRGSGGRRLSQHVTTVPPLLLTDGNRCVKSWKASLVRNPAEDFLKKTLPHFADPAIGVVQTRWGHINKDYSLITQLQAFGLDAHFSIEQSARPRYRPRRPRQASRTYPGGPQCPAALANWREAFRH